MKVVIKSTIKIIGLILLLQSINGVALLGSFLLAGDQIGTYFFLGQVLGVLVYLASALLFLQTPDWMLRPFGVLPGEKDVVIALDKTALRLGLVLLGFYFIVDSGASLLTFVARYILFLGTHDVVLIQTIERELAIQIGRIVSFVAGVVLAFRSQQIVAFLWRKELAESEEVGPQNRE